MDQDAADRDAIEATRSAASRLLPLLLATPPWLPDEVKSAEVRQRHDALGLTPEANVGEYLHAPLGVGTGEELRLAREDVVEALEELRQQVDAYIGDIGFGSPGDGVDEFLSPPSFYSPEAHFSLALIDIGRRRDATDQQRPEPLLRLLLRASHDEKRQGSSSVPESALGPAFLFENLLPHGHVHGAWSRSWNHARRGYANASAAPSAASEERPMVSHRPVRGDDSDAARSARDGDAGAADEQEHGDVQAHIASAEEFWAGVDEDEGKGRVGAGSCVEGPHQQADESEARAERDYWAQYDGVETTADAPLSEVSSAAAGMAQQKYAAGATAAAAAVTDRRDGGEGRTSGASTRSQHRADEAEARDAARDDAVKLVLKGAWKLAQRGGYEDDAHAEVRFLGLARAAIAEVRLEQRLHG